MEFDVKIYQLSSDSQKDYPTGRYPELMCKKGRPYSCLLVDLHQDYFICIPYRSSIQHNNAFLFRGTQQRISFSGNTAFPENKVGAGLFQNCSDQ